MKIDVGVRGNEQVKAALKSLAFKDAQRAVVLWANWIGIEAQGEQRRKLPVRFSLRGTKDGFNSAIVFKEAKTAGMRHVRAELTIAGGFGSSRTKKMAAILARHEEASTRTSTARYRLGSAANKGMTFQGGFFLPAKGLRSAGANPPKSLYPSSIGMQMRRGDGAQSGGRYFAKSKRNTRKVKGQVVRGESFYAIANVGIFRRRETAFGATDGEPIWWFENTVSTPARLGLWDTAQDVIDTRSTMLGLQAVEEVIFRGMLAA